MNTIDEDLKLNDKEIIVLNNKIVNINKIIDIKRHYRELLIAEKYNKPVYMKPKY